MIIYKDIITQDEMFSDIYKIIETCNGICYEVEGNVRLYKLRIQANVIYATGGLGVAHYFLVLCTDAMISTMRYRMVSRTEGLIDHALIGGNASADTPDEGTDSTTVTGVDIVLNHGLTETGFTKESYKQYIKGYMKSIKQKLEEGNPERVKPFMTGAADKVKIILGNFKNYQPHVTAEETTFSLPTYL